MTLKSDIVIIGAGIIGSAIAQRLAKYKIKVIVLEKESDIGFGSTKGTMCNVHTGFREKPGTLKAKLVAKGHDMMEKLCQELEVPFRVVGRLEVALDDGEKNEEIERIRTLKKQAEVNGIKKVSILGKEEALRLEPNLQEDIKGALYIPEDAIVSP